MRVRFEITSMISDKIAQHEVQSSILKSNNLIAPLLQDFNSQHNILLIQWPVCKEAEPETLLHLKNLHVMCQKLGRA